ncbi:MAG TPA: HK97-gp10 family putative phage morphogenesis protein [Candidatus Angelobacter sp.]|jgi:HK97 gp10 family phage protein
MIDLQLQGFDQLTQNLKAFANELQDTMLTNSLVAGAQEVKTEMQAQAPREKDVGPRQKGYQHIADNIVIKAEKNPNGSAAEVYVGPGKSTSYKARWIELGVTAHAIVARMTRQMRKQGIKSKKVLASADQIFGTHIEHPGLSPRPFMRPALQASAERAIAAMRDSLAKNLKAAIRKASKKFVPSRG